ncbi:MAG: cell division protein FtsH [Deltaproteobacteria bacterium RIFOXYD12_FULL_56_24]|nr:MAG: cell division protein FtsH [Deltaproteobacteria bacterium RIFOXYD12_FULL_56_24]
MEKKFQFSLSYLFIALAVFILLQNWLSPQVNNVSYSQFKAHVAEKKINSVVISSILLKGYEKVESDKKEPMFPKALYVTPRIDDKNLVEFLEKYGVDIIAANENTFLRTLLSWILPTLFFVGIWMFMMKRMGQGGAGGMMTLGKSKAKIIAQTDLGVNFESVAGQEEAKVELAEVIEFLKTPEKFTRLGAKIPKGILLVGPPGTGKTLLAKAVAGESGVPFFSISGSDFIEMFVGLGAARVRDLFEQANAKAPCIVFIDELDSLGKARGSGMMGGHDEREQTLNQLLAEMDGFEVNKGVVILAATNRPEILDPALLRPGRFDRHILVDRPDLKERVAILKVHVKGITLAPEVDLEIIARRTPGFTGADLANLANEATLLAVRKGKDVVEATEFEEAIDRIVAGLEKKNRVLNETEKKTVAYHETGHALVATFRKTAEKVHKISIVPRGIGALGYTMQLPTEDRFLMSKTELLEKIDVLLGGRAAEKIIFNEITTGAQNDLQRATEIARSMVAMYGMNEKLGQVTYLQPANQFLQQGLFQPKEFSEHTALLIDEEVRKIIEARMVLAEKTLVEQRPLLEKIAKVLLEKEALDDEEFKALLAEEIPVS